MQSEKRRSNSIEAEQARYLALMMDSLVDLNKQLASLFHTEKPKKIENNATAKILQFKNTNK